MDACKCIVPLRHGDTLNSRRAASPLVWLVEREERWEALIILRVSSPLNWDGTEQKRIVTCMVPKTKANDRGIEVSVGITFQDEDRFNSCQVIYSQFGLAIHQNDHQARRRFVEWAQNEIAVVPRFHKRILFSDKAHFWLNGYVNKQNCRIWSEAKSTIDLLKDTFGDRLISRFGPVNWPPRSCDLTPIDYFLWGYIESLVYADKPQTLDHLEDNIRRVIADIRPQMLEKFIENWTSRLDYIRASPMPEIIFKM
ncbi:hypothetical protein TNCV_3383401 [Trichonephila clavipes]|nr:hypothetical protein TNCV_3383401 [Trichonephila clavipes]